MRVLHLLNWRLTDIEPQLKAIYEQGFDAIQINPLQPLKEDDYNNWWLSYQPCGFRIGNQYGSKKDLINLCNKANDSGIIIIADVICAHTAGKNDGSLYPHEKVDNILKDNPYFWKPHQNVSNWQNRYEVINYCMGLPGLDVRNYDLQDIIIRFLNELIDCGVLGFRFDAAKSMALPNENCDFWTRVLASLKNPYLFNYGEVIFENPYLIDEYSKYLKVLTNSEGRNKDNIVSFFESHDTYLDFGYTKGISSDNINAEYKYLTMLYPNTLYYARPFDDSWKTDAVASANNNKLVYIKH